MTSDLAHYPLSELVIERPKSTIKVRDSSETGPVPFYTSGIKIARHTESLCSGENIYVATGGKANFQFLAGPAAYSTDTYVVTGTDQIETKYLYYFLTSQTDYIDEHLFRGAALRHLSRPEFKALQVPLPSLSEQQRIVHLLDEALEGISVAKANAEKNLQNGRALFESHLQAIFTQDASDWGSRKLSDLVEVQNGYAFSSKEYSDSGHFLMRIGNVQDGFITTSDPKYVKLSPNDSLQRFNLTSGDILISLTGNVGRVGVIKEEHLPAALNQRVARITFRKDSPALSGWVLHFLLSILFRSILDGLGHGTAQKNVSTNDLVNILIPVPDKARQKAFVHVLDELRDSTRSLEAIHMSKLKALDGLKHSLLCQAFSGKRRAA
jgi:type I restriction enzyme S subunit